MKTYQEFTEAALAIKAASNLVPKIMTGIGAVGTLMQATRAEKDAAKERRRQLAKDHGLDPTKPGDRAKLGRLMKQAGDAKGRASKGDTRSPEQYRKDKAEDNKTIDAARKALGQSKAKVGTKERAKIDKELKDFRDELRGVKPEPSTRAKVRVKVGQPTTKLPDVPSTTKGGPRASAQKRAERKSYEAQQRRNRKEEIKENKYRAAANLMKSAGVRNYDDLVRVVSELKNKTKGIKSPLKVRMEKGYNQNKANIPEQLVVPRGLKKKNPFMTPATEMDLLKRLSNRPSVFNRAVTGKRIPGVSEGVHTEGMLPVPNDERKKFLKLLSLRNNDTPKKEIKKKEI